MLRHKVWLLALGVIAVAATAALPTLAAAGSVDTTETWTDQQKNWFGPDPCTGKTVTGIGTESGTASIVETPNESGSGFAHVRLQAHGTVDLYEANGPGPWDPQPGAFVGTWTYDSKTSDQGPPDGQGSTTGVTSGPLVFPDGSSARRQVSFHLTWDQNGPPKVFFAKFVCAG
jgi:hypothetical protein